MSTFKTKLEIRFNEWNRQPAPELAWLRGIPYVAFMAGALVALELEADEIANYVAAPPIDLSLLPDEPMANELRVKIEEIRATHVATAERLRRLASEIGGAL